MQIINFITKYLSKRVIIIGLIYWVITLFTDNIAFDIYTPIPGSNTLKRLLFYGFDKFIFMLIVLLIFQSLSNYITKSKRNNDSWAKQERHFLLILFINIAVFILSYPGNWHGDDIAVFTGVHLLGFQTWQHYFTSLYYIISMMFIPIPSGVIVVQLIIITLINTHIIKWINNNIIKNNWIYAVYIVFILPPILFHNAYPLRNTLYAYIELLFAFQLFRLTYEKGQINLWILTRFSILIAILANWRAEGIYYLLIGPIVCIWLFRIETTLKQKVIFFFLTFILGFLLFIPQKVLSSLDGKNYELTAYMNPLGDLLIAADKTTDKQIINDIGSICLIDSIVLLTEKGVNGECIYWTDKMYKKNLLPENINKFKQAYLKLAFNHLDIYISTQWNLFLTTSLIYKNNRLFTTPSLSLDTINNDETLASLHSSFAKYPFNKPINTKLRNDYYTLICCRDSPSSFEKPTKWLPVFWNNIPPILFLILVTIGLFFTKYRNFGLIVALPLIKLPLIFLTAPAPFFMYYFSLYLIGYMGIFVSIAWLGYKYVPKLFTNKIQS